MDQKKLEDLLKLLQLNQGDLSKLTDQQRKDMKDYKFWKTQPVQKFDEAIDKEGPIDITKTPADVRDEPYPMLGEFEWSTVDINDKHQMEDVFILLNENYVEDKDASFRFNYTKEFFHWALKPPGWREEWNVGVRVKTTGKLVAFISAIPINLTVRGKNVPSVEINFLCVHKQLRSKRMTPVLIKEITRRVNKQNIWQALYTAGVVLPSPVTTCRYAHRPINWNKLQEVGFTDVPAGKTAAEMVALYTLPKDTKTKNLRPMELKDVSQMMTLFDKYESRFELVQSFNQEEFTHWFLGSYGKEYIPENKKVIFTYVVENEDGKISDFFSFYSLPFTVLEHDVHSELGIGYLFYYASDADLGFDDRFSEDATKALKTRLNSLISDATILAKRANMDVFNALTSQDNTLFLEDLKFGPGDGFLNFYLFNYKAFPIGGGLKDDKSYDTVKRSNVGVVML
ncbi:similar to Saccharomyces cerevisiae YLR195C NMT1 N-myristoyl transferase [Maudiozyma barnettii]|uniref:Glycylpeptide N-tetradecanoyltransferase n=1 Tax=Maudiozyma barnettii TaxID=61262 RepID=A0A8H2VE84_9SACH|nr:glycylpeptide N-tetradecanoyltransferase NMT1 [Kazachstania barnettii]CAB4253955.1 similar to Saccharomyces cerevisiae YLR195C NMT1 N-myristoyl transferase [Kazachstania barnettii]CAD1781705.1 similar to Saccharomyces cerevisiae YLR195C NMT1 N-myristoyl transferase [Kazachstania barnettii]